MPDLSKEENERVEKLIKSTADIQEIKIYLTNGTCVRIHGIAERKPTLEVYS